MFLIVRYELIHIVYQFIISEHILNLYKKNGNVLPIHKKTMRVAL